jgi:alpha,alpha-trehalase
MTRTIPANALNAAENVRGTEWAASTRMPRSPGVAPPNPYPPIERHGTIGDRRTAALTADDGTLDWLCLPNYDSPPVFGALIDVARGGFWHFGPSLPTPGRQTYRSDTATLLTRWEAKHGTLELADAMLWPETERPEGRAPRRVVLRRLRCIRGAPEARMAIRPRGDFDRGPEVEAREAGATFRLGDLRLDLWASFPLAPDSDGATAALRLAEGEAAWAVLEFGSAANWSPDAAEAALEETEAYWHEWCRRLTWLGPRRERVRRSALSFHLLSFAPSGALVAAPTLGLPERIGGERNYDYRFAWVRDVSLCMAILAMLGDRETAERYMDWLAGLDSQTDMPIQVLYRIDGSTDATQRARNDLDGYRGSRPVLFGNHAFSQHQIDSYGYLADCSLIYFQQGGAWKPEYWTMLRRLADYTVETWAEPGHDIWELGDSLHYVSSKVMSWVTLERSVQFVRAGAGEADVEPWERAMEAIRADILDRGWSDALGAFRQHYGADTLDASALLIPVMGFLPAGDPKVRATVARIEERLTRGGLVFRFDPEALPTPLGHPLGEAEGAFLPCTFWLASALAKQGEPDRAEAILERVEATAGELGLLAEEMDPATGVFLGNTPLLFSHAEYLKAILEIAMARPTGLAALMAGHVLSRAHRWLPGGT